MNESLKKWIYWIIGISLLIGLIWLIYNYPFKGDKDWLDILAAIGKAFGSIALLALILQIYWRKEERIKKYNPNLVITTLRPKIHTPIFNSDNIYCVCEQDRNDCPSENENIDYVRLFDITKRNPRRFLRIVVKNDHPNAEAIANSIKLKVQINLKSHRNDNNSRTHTLTIPTDESFDLLTNRIKEIYINCDILDNVGGDQGFSFIEASVLDYECKNSMQKVIKGSSNNFTQKNLPLYDFADLEGNED